MYKLGLSMSAVMLGVATFWATMVTSPPKTEADITDKFDINDTLRTASKDVPVQDASMIACTYVLTEEHRCN